jgi:hypothetical protein
VVRELDLLLNELDDALKQVDSVIGQLEGDFRKTGQAVPQEHKYFVFHQFRV